MRSTFDDPRHGKFSSELSDVKRDVPDPSLFRVPEGYEMREDPKPTPSLIDKIVQDVKPVVPQLAPQ
jgi:hypothetical protein